MGAKITKADQIRQLALQGRTVAEIAKLLGVRYQHARHVLDRSHMLPKRNAPDGQLEVEQKPNLTVDTLVGAGFQLTAKWIKCETNGIRLSAPQPKHRGVYAFAKGGEACYVGVASSGFANRLKFYCKPSETQTTSSRLKALIISELEAGTEIDLYAAEPPNFEWNGLLIDGPVGLESGLIRSFNLPWNKRGTNPLL